MERKWTWFALLGGVVSAVLVFFTSPLTRIFGTRRDQIDDKNQNTSASNTFQETLTTTELVLPVAKVQTVNTQTETNEITSTNAENLKSAPVLKNNLSQDLAEQTLQQQNLKVNSNVFNSLTSWNNNKERTKHY